MKIKPYEGPLDRKKMPKEARFAYESYNGQKQKCRNKNNRWFKYYGGKGLDVHYSPREFIGWWLHNKKTFFGKTATVSRIDHEKGYFFDNITMEDVSDNSREAVIRNGLNTTKQKTSVKILFVPTVGNITNQFDSIREASRFLGVSQRLVQFLVRKKYKTSKKVNGSLSVAGGK